MKANHRVEFLVVGAGPAGLCAVGRLIELKIKPQAILWVDPHFEVGDFGTVLSAGSSVPGNTKVESYMRVIAAINKIIEACGVKPVNDFKMKEISPSIECALSLATEPFKALTQRLMTLVPPIPGKVVSINEQSDGAHANIISNTGESRTVLANHVILATGSVPKMLDFELESPKPFLNCNTSFIASELSALIASDPSIKRVAVIGSSHSAALSVMQLLNAGCEVHHFMVGDYRYAEYKHTDTGIAYTKYDNTGLKGEVARFTKALNHAHYKRYRCDHKQQIQALVNQHQDKFTHCVIAIGYQPTSSLMINDKPLSNYTYDSHSLKLNGLTNISGLGIAFPQKCRGYDGEEEYSVGIGKFWTTVNNKAVYTEWMKNQVKGASLTDLSYFGRDDQDNKVEFAHEERVSHEKS